MAARIIDGIARLAELVGQEVAATGWSPVTQQRIDQFAEVTEDRQWIHLDRERAALESPYGATIAHGFLTLSMLSHWSREAVDLRGDFSRRINYGLNRVRFPAAVKAGARIRARFTLKAADPLEGGVQVIWDVTVEIEHQAKPACVAEWVTRLYR